MLGSLEEAQDVLAHRGVALDTKTIRTIAYRYAARARLVQQVEHTAFADTVAGRRVVISSDGGRIRLRETKRGPQTKKGRGRYTGAWREPKVLLVYVVDAEGKRDATFVPVMDATLKGPDAVFALLRTYLQRLEITQADHVLFIADGAPCKPCHHFLYSGGEFTRLYPVNRSPTRNYATKTKRRSRVRYKSALDLRGLMSVPYSRLKAPRM